MSDNISYHTTSLTHQKGHVPSRKVEFPMSPHYIERGIVHSLGLSSFRGRDSTTGTLVRLHLLRPDPGGEGYGKHV